MVVSLVHLLLMSLTTKQLKVINAPSDNVWPDQYLWIKRVPLLFLSCALSLDSSRVALHWQFKSAFIVRSWVLAAEMHLKNEPQRKMGCVSVRNSEQSISLPCCHFRDREVSTQTPDGSEDELWGQGSLRDPQVRWGVNWRVSVCVCDERENQGDVEKGLRLITGTKESAMPPLFSSFLFTFLLLYFVSAVRRRTCRQLVRSVCGGQIFSGKQVSYLRQRNILTLKMQIKCNWRRHQLIIVLKRGRKWEWGREERRIRVTSWHKVNPL